MEAVDQFERVAGKFLEAVHTGGPPPPNHYLGIMAPALSNKVRAIVRGSRLPSEFGEDDVVQVVLERMATRPPNKPSSPSIPARSTVFAWVRTVTTRHVIDLLRMPRTRELPLGESGSRDPRDPGPSQQEELDARLQLNALHELLRRKYPRALPVFDAMREHGWISSKQIAALTGDSPTNVDQIRSRIRSLATQC